MDPAPLLPEKAMVDGAVTHAENRRSKLAFIYGVPIGLLGGLIGLGGAEFRLPVLAGPLGYAARQAVALNLAVTLTTVLAAVGSRGTSLSFGSLETFLPVVLALISGAILGASFGPALAGRLSDRQYERVIFALLLGLGGGLILDSVLAHEPVGLIDRATSLQVGAGLLFGGVIGLFSSLLGVAGGELLIPTLVFAFGVDIKTAGTASLLISAPMVVVGLIGHARQGSFMDRQVCGETVLPMGVGSILGAVVGGLLVNAASPVMLKAILGMILIYSAGQVFLKKRTHGMTFE